MNRPRIPTATEVISDGHAHDIQFVGAEPRPAHPLFGRGSFDGSDYELYEEDGEFALSVEAPGFERDEIELAWDDGILNVAAEHVDEDRGRKRTYHRRFRLPKDVDEDAVAASYRNGVLEVRLPVRDGGATRGTTIPIDG